MGSSPTGFLESDALVYAQSKRWQDMHEVLDALSETEMRSLYRAANMLRLTIWDRLGRPGNSGADDKPVSDPRQSPIAHAQGRDVS